MKAFFLDRDGIINEERGTYTYQLQDFIILPHVLEVLISLKDLGFKLISHHQSSRNFKGFVYQKANECVS